MGKIGAKQVVKIADLKPYERNARTHSEEQVDQIARSIEEFGFLNPVLIDEEKNVIAGHGRIMAAQKLGMTEVPCLFVEGLTEDQRKAYVLADNRLTELGGWDAELISAELQDLKAAGFDIDITGFTIDDIIIDETTWADFDEPTIDDKTEVVPRIKRGEVWQLGQHRLMCGDSTKAEDVAKLMGGGTADLLLTDPPYNVAISNSQGQTIANDDMHSDDFCSFLTAAFTNASTAMKYGAGFYIWYASKSSAEFLNAMRSTGLEPRQQLIWVKNMFTMGRQDYQWRHEPCFYGWKEGGAHYFIDVRSFTTVEDDVDKLTREKAIERLKELAQFSTAMYENKPAKDDLHPTMKPVGLFKKLIRNSSRQGDLVLDLFAGSGTAIVAAEEMNRRCYSMEYDPVYAEVIIQRWEEQTGKTATRVEA